MINAEEQYLGMIEKIIDAGERHVNRTSVDTFRLWVESIRHDMSEGFPLLTTKKMAVKTAFTEQLGFIRGETDIKWYQERGCNIWNADHARWHGPDLERDKAEIARIEEIDILGEAHPLDDLIDSVQYRETHPDSLGYIYGSQWRSLNGFDQLAWILEELRSKSNSRRLIMSAWNPAEFHIMCLPPCHIMYHFSVRGDFLDIAMTQRSCDSGLGVPFNIANTALILEIMAHCSGLIPGIMVWTGHDVHIYENQVKGLTEQLNREPRHLPTLKINKPKLCDPWDIEFEDLEISGYNPHDAIKLPLTVA